MKNMIRSVTEYISQTKSDYGKWKWPKDVPPCPWFRGESECDTPLVPMLYRNHPYDYYENRLNQLFRMRAPGYGKTPAREYTDQWLFLARHVGLPTRLLDWTEGSLIALYFALVVQQNKNKPPVVWMMNPIGLNNLAVGKPVYSKKGYNIYGLTWFKSKSRNPNAASININGAWECDRVGLQKPVAIMPTYIHPRMVAQRSCFTVHGKDKRSLFEQVKSDGILWKYTVDPNKRTKMLEELRIMGISYGTLFPEFDGLTKELTNQFRPDLL